MIAISTTFLKRMPDNGNLLANMDATSGAFVKLQQILDDLPIRNVLTWNTLIAGYAQQRRGEEALKWFNAMLREGCVPDAVTFTCVLKACGCTEESSKGKEIHGMIARLGMLNRNVVLGSALVHMYAKCGMLSMARRVLEELPVRNVFSWTALICGYAQKGQGEEALKCFDSMLQEGHSPNAVTFTCALKACGSIGATVKGQEIHDCIVSLGMLEKNIVLASAVVDMHVKCGALAKARQVLDELPARNVVTWSTLIAGYAQHGQGEEALKCFDDMIHDGHSPNTVTFSCALNACGSNKAIAQGEEIHEMIVSLGLLEKDAVLRSTLVDMYAKCGAFDKAWRVFKGLPVRDVVTWSALIARYAQHGQGEQALKYFDSMLEEGHFPNAVAFACVLKACGDIGVATKGKEIHDKIVGLGILEEDVVLGNTLVDMYVKCGAVAKAQQVLEELPVQDVFTWSTLIAGYAQQGHSVEVINCFERMQSKGVNPNSITLISVLNACGNAGLFTEAETYFSGMSIQYGIQPNLEHYCCMADLFGRAGKINKALSVIAEMMSDACFPMWVALLSICRECGEVKLGRLAFECALELDSNSAAIYVLMADIYRAADMQDDAGKVEAMRIANKAWKMPYYY